MDTNPTIPNSLEGRVTDLEYRMDTHVHSGNDLTQRIPPITQVKNVMIKVFDDLSIVTAGNSKFMTPAFPASYDGLTLTAVKISVSDASSSGSITIQIRNVTQSVDMLSTVATIDQGELTSATAATPEVINVNNAVVSENDQIAIDVDGAGTDAYGLGVVLSFS